MRFIKEGFSFVFNRGDKHGENKANERKSEIKVREELLDFKPENIYLQVIENEKVITVNIKGGTKWEISDLTYSHVATSIDGCPIFQIKYECEDKEGKRLRVSYNQIVTSYGTGRIFHTGMIESLNSAQAPYYWDGKRDMSQFDYQAWGSTDIIEGNFRYRDNPFPNRI